MSRQCCCWYHKLKLKTMEVMKSNYILVLIVLCSSTLINSSVNAQNRRIHRQIFQRRNGWGMGGPPPPPSYYPPPSSPYPHHHHQQHSGHNYYLNQIQNHLNPMPSASYAYGSYQNALGGALGGGKILETVKASIHPLHLGKPTLRGPYNGPPVGVLYGNAPLPPTVSYAPAQYSGYFYMQDKHRKPIRPPPQSFYTNAYFPGDSLWAPVPNHPPTSAYHPSQGQLPAPPAPPPPPPVLQPQHSQIPRLPGIVPSGPVAGASMETYQEALNLFSEVVQKLEKDPRHAQGLGGIQTSPSSLLSNGIYGSSLSIPPTVGGFPPHLDHIMGPEFLQRAHKLYNKIIKEQNARMMTTQGSHYQNPNSVHPSGILYNKQQPYHRGYGGLSYLEGAIHGGGNHIRKSDYQNARSTLVDSVKALELQVSNDNNYISQQTMDQIGSASSTEEIMMTAESNSEPETRLVPSPIKERPMMDSQNDIVDADMLSSASSAAVKAAAAAATAPQQSQSSSSNTFPRKFPQNDNDFIEHPLPYAEYEGLIKDIAINHNYKK